jgi:zinc and cadmium transporter
LDRDQRRCHFAAGNFLYIGASDLVPEVNKHRELGRNVEPFIAFTSGLVILFVIRLALGE